MFTLRCFTLAVASWFMLRWFMSAITKAACRRNQASDSERKPAQQRINELATARVNIF